MRQEYILRLVLEGWALWKRWCGTKHHPTGPREPGRARNPIRVFLPSYSPELNPAERIFEEVRRRVEGKVYESLHDKPEEAESYLKELARPTPSGSSA